jgi:hypothetical protein
VSCRRAWGAAHDRRMGSLGMIHDPRQGWEEVRASHPYKLFSASTISFSTRSASSWGTWQVPAAMWPPPP